MRSDYMELKHGKYIWWGKSIEQVIGTLKRIEPSTDKNGEQRRTEKGILKYNLIVHSVDFNEEVYITIIESQRKFWDTVVGMYGKIVHNPENNYLTFEELEDPLVQSTLADYDFDLVEISHEEEGSLSMEVLESIRDDYERQLGEIKQRLSAVNYALEKLCRVRNNE
jgi:hypothetical protein